MAGTEWETEAESWVRWAWTPGHDAYWAYREPFLDARAPAPAARTVEIGCGEGRVLRDLRDRGHRMMGIELSPTLVRAAQAADPGGIYILGDAAALPLAGASCDLVVSYNSLMDIVDMATAVQEAGRVLVAGGRLCICVTHPMSNAGRFVSIEADADFVVSGTYFGRRRFEATERRNGLAMTFRGWSYSLEQYVAALSGAGFVIEAVHEPVPEAPTELLRRWCRVPMFLHIRAWRLELVALQTSGRAGAATTVVGGAPGSLVGTSSIAAGAEMAIVAFVAGAVVSLGTSWILVTRLERLGERIGMSEALLGLVAALAADVPEITSAVTALTHHQQAVGSGVVIGSNVFNLAALLGLGAVVARRIDLHRKVVALGGAVAIWLAVVCVATVVGVVGPVVGLLAGLVVFVPYAALLAVGAGARSRLSRLPPRWTAWMAAAVAEEEDELSEAIRPRPGTAGDAVVAVGALIVIVAASVVMERSATILGDRYDIAGIVVGGLVLAAVTSLPNAVAGVYLAARGRGAAMLSTTLNSNALNVLLGLLLPAAIIGLAHPSGRQMFIAWAYVALTVVTLAFAAAGSGLRRGHGVLIIAGYGVFAVVLVTAR